MFVIYVYLNISDGRGYILICFKDTYFPFLTIHSKNVIRDSLILSEKILHTLNATVDVFHATVDWCYGTS